MKIRRALPEPASLAQLSQTALETFGSNVTTVYLLDPEPPDWPTRTIVVMTATDPTQPQLDAWTTAVDTHVPSVPLKQQLIDKALQALTANANDIAECETIIAATFANNGQRDVAIKSLARHSRDQARQLNNIIRALITVDLTSVE